MNKESVAYYRRLPYRRVVLPEEGDDSYRFVARIEEMSWIWAYGDSREEALLKLDEVFDGCLEALIEDGEEIPEPLGWPEGYGGPLDGSEGSVSLAASEQVAFEIPTEVAPWTSIEVDAPPVVMV
jgi:predicted RNase H-like HicB family nuclease